MYMNSSKRVMSTLCSSRVRVVSWIRVFIHKGRNSKNIPGATDERLSVTKMGFKHCADGKTSRWCYSTLLWCLWCLFFVSDIEVLILCAFFGRNHRRGHSKRVRERCRLLTFTQQKPWKNFRETKWNKNCAISLLIVSKKVKVTTNFWRWEP